MVSVMASTEGESVVEQLMREGAAPLLEKAREIGLAVSKDRLSEWVRDGARGVRLEAVRVGGRWHTSAQALRRFLARTTEAAR